MNIMLCKSSKTAASSSSLSTTLSSTKASSWTKVGDIIYLLVIANSLIFAYAVVFYNSSSIFDPLWRPEGFCVINRDTPHFNSHDLCLYVDIIGALVVGFLSWSLKDVHGMKTANDYVKISDAIGIFAHGVGHKLLSNQLNGGQTQENTGIGGEIVADSASSYETYLNAAFLLFFWMGLLKASIRSFPYRMLVPMAIVSSIFNSLVPEQFGFTFVQTVLLIAFSLNQLLRPNEEKSMAYALYPAMTGFPITLIGWLESTQCSGFVSRMGGHFIYDAYIPISIICFYVLCFYFRNELDGGESNETHRSDSHRAAARSKLKVL